MVKDFFYHRVRPNLFADRVDTELRGRFFLVAQTCFLQGILFVDYVQDVLPETFEQTSPYILLLAGTTVVGGYYLAKLCLYHFRQQPLLRCAAPTFVERHLFRLHPLRRGGAAPPCLAGRVLRFAFRASPHGLCFAHGICQNTPLI